MLVCIEFTPVYAESHKIFTLLHKPHPLSSSQDHLRRKFSQDHPKVQKLNQFIPVLALAELTKNLKFSTFCINFTQFCFEFLKEFYIFRISGPSGSFWYQWLQDSSSINEEKYCSKEIAVSIQFLLHSNLCDSLINNIKTIFL